MKISKRQLKRIIKEEKAKLTLAEFGSNSRRIQEMRGVDRGIEEINTTPHTPKQSAESQLNWIDIFAETWERHANEDEQQRGVLDPRLEELEELFHTIRERLYAIVEDRE